MEIMPGISQPCCGTLPLLPDIHEQNVAFVICASEREPSRLCVLKELLIKTLFSLASKPVDSMFSVFSSATKELKWRPGMVECSLTNVAEASAWIRALHCGSEVMARSAVAAALEEPTCQAVYLFTSGLPKSATEESCSHLSLMRPTCPIHTVHLIGNDEHNKNSSQEILEKVAQESGGSFQVIRLNCDRTSDEDNPGCFADIHHSNCMSQQHCSPLLTDHHKAHFSLGAQSSNSPNIFLGSSVKEDLVDWFPEIHDFQRGIRVLARKETDGYYYLGHIVQQVKGSRERVLIEFERSQRSLKGKVQLRMQETPLYDVIHHEDGRWQPLAPGDKILAPWEKKGERYGPGVVLQVAEMEPPHSAFKNSKVLVNFWNGQTKEVSADVAVKIPPSWSERIVLELQMPLGARQMLLEQNPDYPAVVPPGYRASGPCRHNHFGPIHWHNRPKAQCAGPGCRSPHRPLCHFCFPAWESVRSLGCTVQPDDALIPGTDVTKEELIKKIEEQLSKGRLPISKSCVSEQDASRKLKKEKNSVDLKSSEATENAIAKPKKDHQRERASGDPREGTGTKVDVAVNTDKRVAWQNQKGCFQPSMNKSLAQPSQRSPPQQAYAGSTSRLQTMFAWVDQSLKKDHSAIQSALPMRRSYSAPSVQRLGAKEAAQDGSREKDIDMARVEFRRKKWEQRRLKEEQKNQEEHLKRELLLEKKRQRSHQRTLQGSQKQQQTRDRAGQHMEQLQAARAEWKRQELALQEEERNRENQRLDFLKRQHGRREKGLTEHNQSSDDHEKKRLELLRNRMQAMQKSLEVATQEQDIRKREKEANKGLVFQKRDRMSQQVEKENQKQRDLQQHLREQSLLLLRASLLP
ncbi:uncharacterized protein LOC128326893 [Hemicordylus capensis]|uniref:uncharacterized protein LOC128326893 n=1 Tax=Hemicordylus capensis TaxID=884348 RepID=UPI00230450C7|nr:uncharacterized protein LOC128326893 [Hemicordylus capensis]